MQFTAKYSACSNCLAIAQILFTAVVIALSKVSTVYKRKEYYWSWEPSSAWIQRQADASKLRFVTVCSYRA